MYSPQSLASIILKISLLLLFSNSLCTGIRFEKECSSQNPLIRDENTRATVPIGDESGRFQVLVSDPGYSPGEQKLVSVTMSNEVSEQINAFLMSAFDRNDNLVGQWSARLSDGSKWRVANCGGSGNVFVVEEWPSHEIPIAVWTPGSSTQGPITIRAVVVTERDRRAYNVRPIRLQPRTNILSTVSLERFIGYFGFHIDLVFSDY